MSLHVRMSQYGLDYARIRIFNLNGGRVPGYVRVNGVHFSFF